MRIKFHLSLRVAPSLISFKDHVDNFLSRLLSAVRNSWQNISSVGPHQENMPI